jgi:hypothetical protein
MDMNKKNGAKDDFDNISQASKFAPSHNSAFKPLRKSKIGSEKARQSQENSTPNETKAVAVIKAESNISKDEGADLVAGKLDFQKIIKEEAESAVKHSQDSNDLKSVKGEGKNVLELN